MRSGIILSGGKSSRLGKDKGLVELEGKPLVQWVIERLVAVTDEIIVVVGSNSQLSCYRRVVEDKARVISDYYPDKSPLIGLISGLREACSEYAAVCACDMPFIDPNILELMFCVSDGLNGAQLIKHNGWVEPFPSIYYVTKCLQYAEDLRVSGEMRIRKVLETMDNTVKLPVEKLRKYDPELASFNDFDTLESLEVARRMVKSTGT